MKKLNLLLLNIFLLIYFIPLSSGYIYSVGESTQNTNTVANRTIAMPFTTNGADIEISEMGVNIGTPTGNIQMGIYSSTGSAPASLMVSSSSHAASSGWNNFSIPSIILSPFTQYWVAIQSSSTSGELYKSGAIANQKYMESGSYDLPIIFTPGGGGGVLNVNMWIGSSGGFLINSWNNSYTNNSDLNLNIISPNPTINFTINATGQHSLNWFVNSINQSWNYTYFNYLFNITGIYNVSVYLDNLTLQTFLYKKWTVQMNITLNSPSNNSIFYFDFPPMSSSINHTWSNVGYPYYNIKISSDPLFHTEIANIYTAHNYYSKTLQNGTYYWKVRSYNPALQAFGSYTNTSIYTNIANFTTNGITGIGGVVYELVDGQETPISGVIVSIQNSSSSWSSSVITSSNGYYEFSNLIANATYYIKASKTDLYLDSLTSIITPTNGAYSLNNILLQRCLSPYTCLYNQEYQTIIVQRPNGTVIPWAEIEIYKSDGVVPLYTAHTDGGGSYKVQLTKDQQYKVIVMKSDENLINTETFTPSSTPLIITLGGIAFITPFATPLPGTSTINKTGTSKPWSIQNATNHSLNSEIGLGLLGQGITAATVNWVIVGAGGAPAALFASAIMAELGILNWTTIAFYAFTALSFYIIRRI